MPKLRRRASHAQRTSHTLLFGQTNTLENEIRAKPMSPHPIKHEQRETQRSEIYRHRAQPAHCKPKSTTDDSILHSESPEQVHPNLNKETTTGSVTVTYDGARSAQQKPRARRTTTQSYKSRKTCVDLMDDQADRSKTTKTLQPYCKND